MLGAFEKEKAFSLISRKFVYSYNHHYQELVYWFRNDQLLCYQVSIGLLFILCVWFIPESPVYLAARAEFEAAEQSLEWLGRKPDSLKFFKEVQTDMHVFDTTLAKSWRQYTDPRVYKPFLACLALMFFFQVKRLKIFSPQKISAAQSGKIFKFLCQACGYNTVLAYSLSIFHESGGALQDDVAMGVKGAVVLLSAVIALATAR